MLPAATASAPRFPQAVAELLLEGDAQLPPFKLQCQKEGVDPTSLLLAQEPCTAAKDVRASLRRWLPSISTQAQLGCAAGCLDA
jgi:hypothetical protein